MKPVENDYFTTELRVRQWKRRLQRMGLEVPEREGGGQDDERGKGDEGGGEETGDEHGTVGAGALDRDGHLAGATSTGGLTAKRWGRIGDSPIIGAGTYAADDACAVSCAGTGEEFIRNGIARMVAARMQLKDEDVQTAAEKVIGGRLEEGDGGVIAVSHTGRIAFVYNTGGTFRGACDADGRFEVRIWEDEEELPENGE